MAAVLLAMGASGCANPTNFNSQRRCTVGIHERRFTNLVDVHRQQYPDGRRLDLLGIKSECSTLVLLYRMTDPAHPQRALVYTDAGQLDAWVVPDAKVGEVLSAEQSPEKLWDLFAKQKFAERGNPLANAIRLYGNATVEDADLKGSWSIWSDLSSDPEALKDVDRPKPTSQLTTRARPLDLPVVVQGIFSQPGLQSPCDVLESLWFWIIIAPGLHDK
jgi:hypothetical protein